MNEHSNEAQLLMNEHSNEAQFDPNFNIVLTWLLVKIKQQIIYYQVRVINYYDVDFSQIKRNKIWRWFQIFFLRYNFFEEPQFYKTVANGHSRIFCLRDLSKKKEKKISLSNFCPRNLIYTYAKFWLLWCSNYQYPGLQLSTFQLDL